MWRKEDAKPQGVPEISTAQAGVNSAPAAPQNSGNLPSANAAAVSSKAVACISQGIRIKGEVTGKEDLFVDGQLEGKLDLGGASITVGPNGKVKADISAREVVVRGRVEGKVVGRERVQLWNTGYVSGEVQTDRLAIEDGAILSGKVEAGKPQTKSAETQAAAAGAGKASSTVAVNTGTAAI